MTCVDTTLLVVYKRDYYHILNGAHLELKAQIVRNINPIYKYYNLIEFTYLL